MCRIYSTQLFQFKLFGKSDACFFRDEKTSQRLGKIPAARWADPVVPKIHFDPCLPITIYLLKPGSKKFSACGALPLAVTCKAPITPKRWFLDSSRRALSSGKVSEIFMRKIKSYQNFLSMSFQKKLKVKKWKFGGKMVTRQPWWQSWSATMAAHCLGPRGLHLSLKVCSHWDLEACVDSGMC